MASFSFSDLMTSVTTDEQEEVFLAALEGVGLKARSWRKGGSLRTILRVVAATYAAFTDLAVRFAKSAFLELSTGGWLTLLAANVYNVQRVAATFATGKVTLTNAGGGIYGVGAEQLTLVNAVTGKTYRNVSAFTLNALTSLDIDVRAVEIGSDSNATPGQVTEFETSPSSDVTVTNAASIIGTDEEKDEELRVRCLFKLGTLSGLGPRYAYEYAARTATRTDGSIVNVNRVAVVSNSSTGAVTVYIATEAGAPPTADVAFVQTSIDDKARPDTVTATAVAASGVAISRTLTVWAKQTAGMTTSALGELVQAKLDELSSTYPIGGLVKPPSTQGYFYASRLDAAVISAHSSIYDVDGSGADVALAAGEIPALTTTLDVRLVP